MGTPTSARYKDIWKSELKNNIHLFRLEILSIHTTREDATEAESVEQRLLFSLGDPLWVNQSYANVKFLGTKESAAKAAATAKKRGKTKESAIKGHITRKINGTDKTGAAKGVNTKKSKGIPLGATKESAAKRKETLIKNGKPTGWTKSSVAKGLETKIKEGLIIQSTAKMVANARKKSARDNVNELRELCKKTNTKLMQGWYKKSDEWVNAKIGELNHLFSVF